MIAQGERRNLSDAPTSPWRSFDRLAIGQAASIRERITMSAIAAMAEATGDDNPIHIDLAQATAAGHSRPVAHGLILLGLLSRLIGTRLPGPGSLWFDHQIEFINPAYAGDEVTLTVRVALLSPATRVVVLDVEGTNGAGIAILRGRAKVRVPGEVGRRITMDDREKVAIVTGGSGGIGRAVCEALGARGMRVVIGYRIDQAAADDCARAVRAAGGEALAVAADVSNPAEAPRLVDAAEERFGRVDAIVHAATPAIVQRPWLETSADDLRAHFDTYVVGLHALAQRAVPGMKARQFGRIVGILSSAIAEVPPKMSAYITGKQALLGFCRALAVEVGPWNISVNTVSPSMVISEYADQAGAGARDAMARKTPLRRLAQAEEVAGAVVFLLGHDGSFVSGANLPVTGGVFM
jgi:3-oxoacyl-[acyl-carrier protein] reductase